MSDFPLPVLFIMAVFFSMWMIMRVFHKHEKAKRARYAGRPASASTAAGLMSKHLKELEALLEAALG